MSYTNLLSHDKKIIIYRPELNKITGNPLATIMLCQVIYWSAKYEYEEFYKNIYRSNKTAKKNKQASWMEELGFNRYQTEKAINKLTDLSLIQVRIENSTHNTYIKLNKNRLEELLQSVYTTSTKKMTPVVEGEQRQLFPVVEGEQPTVVEGEQSPLSKVNNGTNTETTQRLHKEGVSKFLKPIDDDSNFTLTSTKIKKMFSELDEETRIKVKQEAEKYLSRFPLIGNSKKFKYGVLSAKIAKYKTRQNA